MANEKRLIDANALRKVFINEECNCEMFPWAVDNAPTVDAVEVVRCKKCMWARPKDHREPTDTPRELICQCPKHHYIPAPWYARMAVKPDDFCSYGEIRESANV